jgi:telomere length regulation protein
MIHFRTAVLGSLAYLVTKLVNLGVFPASLPVARSAPSFWLSALPAIRRHLPSKGLYDTQYASYWSLVLAAVPSIMTLQTILNSLCTHIPRVPEASIMSPSASIRGAARRSAMVLYRMIQIGSDDTEDVWEAARSVMLTPRGATQWNEGDARVFVCAAAEAKTTDGETAYALYH